MIGKVNKIIPMSVVDGPGNRTAIFFQGCNFNCKYCHNPETINHCIHCGTCVPHCPVGALSVVGGKVVWDPVRCIDCDQCIKICPYNASPKISFYTPEALAAEVVKNRPFIQGVSTSGGECTLQYEFLTAFYRQIHGHPLTCYADTNGGLDLSQDIYRDFVSETDGFMLDVKAWDEEDHIALTGRSNDTVKKNLSFLAEAHKLVEIRCVCPDSLDNERTLRGIFAAIGDSIRADEIALKLISYRHYGVREEFLYLQAPPREEMERLSHLAQELGFPKVIFI